MKLYGVLVGGPTLSGYVALCSSEQHAKLIARDINRKNMYKGEINEETGLSKAWEMGDGKAAAVHCTECLPETTISEFFEWK